MKYTHLIYRSPITGKGSRVIFGFKYTINPPMIADIQASNWSKSNIRLYSMDVRLMVTIPLRRFFLASKYMLQLMGKKIFTILRSKNC